MRSTRPPACHQPPWVQQLVHFARRHGYRVDELVEIINDAARCPAVE